MNDGKSEQRPGISARRMLARGFASAECCRMSATMRLYMTIVQALLLVAILAGIGLYSRRVYADDRAVLARHTQQTRALLRGLAAAMPGPAAVREALDFNLEVMEQVIDRQGRYADRMHKALVGISALGVAIVAAMSILVVRSVARKYPELREER